MFLILLSYFATTITMVAEYRLIPIGIGLGLRKLPFESIQSALFGQG